MVRIAVFLFIRDQNPQEESCCELEWSPGGSRLEEQKASHSALEPQTVRNTAARQDAGLLFTPRSIEINGDRLSRSPRLPGQDKLVFNPKDRRLIAGAAVAGELH